VEEVRIGPRGRRYAFCASETLSPSTEDRLFSFRGIAGAAESVCASLLWVRAASASERVLGVRPEGVEGGKACRVGSWRVSCVLSIVLGGSGNVKLCWFDSGNWLVFVIPCLLKYGRLLARP
jgi:hypothetical protein